MPSVLAGAQPRPARNDLLASPAAPCALALLALLLPARSFQEAIFVACLGLALITFWIWGRLFGRVALDLSLSPWTAVYLGQFALLAAASPIFALNGLAK